MATPIRHDVIIRPSYCRLCIVNALALIPFVLGLLIIGFPVGDLFSHPLNVAGLLLIFSFWVFGASVMGLLMFTVTIREEGIRQLLPPRLLRWDEMRSFRSMFPFPAYVASANFFNTRFVCLPKPWLVAEPDKFVSAIKQYAPENHPIRKHVLSRLPASG